MAIAGRGPPGRNGSKVDTFFALSEGGEIAPTGGVEAFDVPGIDGDTVFKRPSPASFDEALFGRADGASACCVVSSWMEDMRRSPSSNTAPGLFADMCGCRPSVVLALGKLGLRPLTTMRLLVCLLVTLVIGVEDL